MLKKLFIILVSGLILTSCAGTQKNVNSGGSITAGSQEDLIVNVGDRVFFEFDSFELTVDGQSTLDAQAAWLKQYNKRVKIIFSHDIINYNLWSTYFPNVSRIKFNCCCWPSAPMSCQVS